MNKENYEFTGKHLMVNYIDCNCLAINNAEKLENVMKNACQMANSTILNTSRHLFPIENSSLMGISIVIILAESHASIHTYPEHNSCFIDFFTCGNRANPGKFNEILKKYLKPKKTYLKTFLRENLFIKEVKNNNKALDLAVYSGFSNT